ncbi:MAG TPA: large conductance mechanosensitive channel protein MscL [Candidatus Paceibacterota bacterium]|nr:large conductance mechanosensitive channel protein MscL [Candidatus Paceibacterota bacterium]
MKGFRDFILRGNVVDLAVGVVIGAAFNSVVQSLVKDVLTPFIAAVVKQPDFSKLQFTIHGSIFLYGDFLNALISFIIVAGTIYFFVVLPINKMMTRFKKPAPPEPEKKPEDVILLEQIRDLLREKNKNSDTIA